MLFAVNQLGYMRVSNKLFALFAIFMFARLSSAFSDVEHYSFILLANLGMRSRNICIGQRQSQDRIPMTFVRRPTSLSDIFTAINSFKLYILIYHLASTIIVYQFVLVHVMMQRLLLLQHTSVAHLKRNYENIVHDTTNKNAMFSFLDSACNLNFHIGKMYDVRVSL